MNIVALLFYLAALLLLFRKLAQAERRKNSEPEPSEPLDFYAVQEVITRMNDTTNQLVVIERMMTDMQLCDEEHTQSIQCTWNDAVHENNNYTFQLKKSDNDFLCAAMKEREELRTSLQEDIDLLIRIRSQKNDQKNERKTIPEKRFSDTAGEGVCNGKR